MASEDLVLDILKESGKITDADVAACQDSIGVRASSVLELIVMDGMIKEEELVTFLADYFAMESIIVADNSLPPEITDLVPAEFARDHKLIPIRSDAGVLTVAMTNPMDVDTIDNLMVELNKSEKTQGFQIETIVAGPVDVQNSIDLYYRGQQFAAAVDEAASDDYNDALKGIGNIAGTETDDEAPIIRFVSAIISQAHSMRCSDIHVEPLEKRIRIRYRIDGVCKEMESPPKRLQGPIISRLKIMSGMNMAERRVPQDGRIKFKIDAKITLDLRVSALPGTHGESVVMRILDKSSLMLGLNELGLLEDDEAVFRSLIALPNGVLLVTGPTGSGKTTTLYGCLNFLNKPDVKLVTVEDPVEYMLSGINQVMVNDEINFGFSQALRSILRQAPNIIMVGEIRDTTTAEIATQASLTGHLVFSTLHTNDAPSAVTRLIDMGVKPFLVATSVMGVMAQRLVRTVCKNCRVEYTPDSQVVGALKLSDEYMSSHTWTHGAGCDECNNTGFRGRKGIFELMVVNDEIRHLIYECAPANEIRAVARKSKMKTLREDGLKKAEIGITTLEDVLRITAVDEA